MKVFSPVLVRAVGDKNPNTSLLEGKKDPLVFSLWLLELSHAGERGMDRGKKVKISTTSSVIAAS